jgi:hypothetical protein
VVLIAHPHHHHHYHHQRHHHHHHYQSFNALSSQISGIPHEEMLFFDNERRNVQSVVRTLTNLIAPDSPDDPANTNTSSRRYWDVCACTLLTG